MATLATTKEDTVIQDAAPILSADRGVPFLPLPNPDMPNGAHPENADPQVLEAWRKHIITGFEQNSEMFKQMLEAFMRPYWLTVNMYRVLFVVGIAGVFLAVILGVLRGPEFALIFGGLSLATFLGFFITQPLRALEQNIQFITWLGVIYNTYWTRLMYANNNETIQTDLEEISKTTIQQINELLDKHTQIASKRPTLTNDKMANGKTLK